jgi:hypothetical protein
MKYTDAAMRVHDTYSLHRLADPLGNIGKWFAVSLADGRSDNVLYDSKSDAIRHQHGNELNYGYIQIVPANMTPQMAETFLGVQRKLSAAGIRVIDPDSPGGGVEMIPRSTVEDQKAQIRAMFNPGARPRNLLVPGRDF